MLELQFMVMAIRGLTILSSHTFLLRKNQIPYSIEAIEANIERDFVFNLSSKPLRSCISTRPCQNEIFFSSRIELQNGSQKRNGEHVQYRRSTLPGPINVLENNQILVNWPPLVQQHRDFLMDMIVFEKLKALVRQILVQHIPN